MADHRAGAPPATVNPSSPTSGSRERRELLSLPLCFVILEREGCVTSEENRTPWSFYTCTRTGLVPLNRTGLFRFLSFPPPPSDPDLVAMFLLFF